MDISENILEEQGWSWEVECINSRHTKSVHMEDRYKGWEKITKKPLT